MAFTTIQGSGGAPDSFLGTAGVDVIALQNQAEPAFLSARQDADIVTFTSFTQVLSGATLYGGQGNDQLTSNGTALANSFVAQNEGNDTIALLAVTNSTVQGNEGADLITTTGLITSALVNGNQGNDTVNVNGGASAGSIFSGVGFDQVNVAGNLSGGTRVQANEDDDIITIAATVSVQDSTINGNQGNDNIVVAGALTAFANSTIYGGSGNDIINTTAAGIAVRVSTDDGNDTVTLGAGNNQVFNSAGNDNITDGAGNDSITSSAGNATITLAGNGNNSVNAVGGNINVTGGTGTDTIVTGTGTDTIATGAGASTVDAGGGNDQVTGAATAQSLNGGTGNDTITGAGGADQLSGAAGADRFVQANNASVARTAETITEAAVVDGETMVFGNGVDVITDFSAAQGDVIFGGNAGAITTYAAGSDVRGNLTADNFYQIRGTWTAGTSTFAVAAAGSDLLVIQGVGGANFTAAAQTGAMILTGINGVLAGAQFV